MADFDPNDRRGWKYSHDADAIGATARLLQMLTGEEPFDTSRFTARSLPTWRTVFENLDIDHWRQLNLGVSTTVRHPAPDMAYVFALPIHPDQTEPFVIAGEGPTIANLYMVSGRQGFFPLAGGAVKG